MLQLFTAFKGAYHTFVYGVLSRKFRDLQTLAHCKGGALCYKGFPGNMLKE